MMELAEEFVSYFVEWLQRDNSAGMKWVCCEKQEVEPVDRVGGSETLSGERRTRHMPPPPSLTL